MTFVSDDVRMVKRFTDAMAERLEYNATVRGKSGWEYMTPKQLLRRAEQELGELRHAVESKSHWAVVTREAADVGNFCAMLATVYAKRLETVGGGSQESQP